MGNSILSNGHIHIIISSSKDVQNKATNEEGKGFNYDRADWVRDIEESQWRVFTE